MGGRQPSEVVVSDPHRVGGTGDKETEAWPERGLKVGRDVQPKRREETLDVSNGKRDGSDPEVETLREGITGKVTRPSPSFRSTSFS